MSNLRERLKRFPPAKIVVLFWRAIGDKHGLFEKISALSAFFFSYGSYRKMPRNNSFLLETEDLYPRLFDNSGNTHVDPVYFYQDTWCAKKIFENQPKHHYDIGSSAEFVGIISQFIPTTMVDIRPLPVSLPSLSFEKGSILNLPFGDDGLASVSSICVIEHVGLGRYGDPLDQFGSEKAADELKRVLSPGGNLYVSVPVDNENRVYFNAHRAFTRDYVLELFKPFKLVEEKYVYGNRIFHSSDKPGGFGTGLFHFKK